MESRLARRVAAGAAAVLAGAVAAAAAVAAVALVAVLLALAFVTGVAAGLGLAATVAGAAAVRRSRRAAARVPLSPLCGGWFVGPDYPERAGIAVPGSDPAGEMDDFDAYARAGFDPGAVHPEVRRFYERTGEYELRYRTRWHRGFRLGARVAARVTSRVEQLNLPGPGAMRWRRLRSRFVDVDPDADPRREARAWVRTDPETGAAVFVAVYATHERDGETFNNIAVPLPGGNLSTVLRMTGRPDGGVELTASGPGDPGLYLVTPVGGFALPMRQRFRVWPAESATPGGTAGDGDGRDGGPGLAATHEMWLLGRQFLTVEYVIERASATREDR